MRQLERAIGRLARNVALRFAEGQTEPVTATTPRLKDAAAKLHAQPFALVLIGNGVPALGQMECIDDCLIRLDACNTESGGSTDCEDAKSGETQSQPAAPTSTREQRGEASSWLLQPQVNVPVFSPSSIRGEPISKIAVPSAAPLLIFSLELDGAPAYQTYRATLSTAQGRRLWQSGILQPSPEGALTISFPAAFFQAGDYLLALEEGCQIIEAHYSPPSARANDDQRARAIHLPRRGRRCPPRSWGTRATLVRPRLRQSA